MKLEILDRTDLAVRALRLLSDLEHASSRQLADRLDTSPGFLTQVLAPLVQSGVLISSRGPGGGYRFGVDPEDVTMLEVIEAIEGPTDDGRCVLENAPCPRRELCSLHDAWVAAREALLQTLSATAVIDPTPQEVAS